MREFGPRIVEFVESQGINGATFIMLVGLLFALLSLKSLRTWNKMLYYQKWLLVSELLGSISVTIAGFVMLLKKLL